MPTHGGGCAGSRCPLDSCGDNPEGVGDGGEQKENYNDSRPGSSETSEIAMAFMAGLTVGKNWLRPLIISKRSIMGPSVVTERGAESSLIISRRSAQPLTVPLLPDSLGPAHASGLGQVLSLVPDPSISSSHGRGLDPMPLPVMCGEETSSGPVVGSPGILLRGSEVSLEPIRTRTTLVGNSPEEDMVNFIKKSIPSKPYFPTGGTLIYESKEGEKDQFIKRRSIWLSEHTGRKPYAFKDSLVLKGPRRPMTAYDGCWIIQIDVPVESSFKPEGPEMPGRVFETTLFLDDDSLDKPMNSLLSIRGGFVNITSVTFSNAVHSSIRFLLCSHPDGSFNVHPKVEGELVLSVENHRVGFTIFKNQVEDDAVHFVRYSGTTAFKLPLTRDVVALPIGSLVRVLGTLKLATLKVFVDQYLVLDKNVVWAGWTVETGMYAAICIQASSFL